MFKGKGEVYTGNQKISLTEGHEFALNTEGKPKPHDFEPRQFEDEFYRWNGLRSGICRKRASMQPESTLVPDLDGMARTW